MKALIEKKNSLIDEMEGILATAKAEVRAFNEEEDARVEELKKEIRGLEKLIESEEEVRTFDKKEIKTEKEDVKMTKEEIRSLEVEKEERAFIDAVVNGELRNLSVAHGTHGTLVPVTIANDIIETVKEMCPLLDHADIYHVAGDLRIPKYNGNLSAAYVTEFNDVVESTSTFTTIELKNQIIGVLTKISKSLINRAGFDVRSFIVEKVAKAIVEFLEKEMLTANGVNIQGAIQTATTATAANADRLASEDLVELQMTIPTAYQKNCMWIMHKDVLKALRKLKTADGQFILNADATTPFGWTILGRPVYLSDSMPRNIATGQNVMLYMDPSGYAVKIAKSMELQVLMEKYAAQYAIGVCAFAEIDAKIADESKIARLVMA